ncbi:hypothetical protein GMB86_10540 [Terrilactibacillus sp. BCM23-1]|uniref:Uncharacterized protein n=1 Tax=Terrilactibacillus tamarindi TaxID=2599694 RepID=A0A6N8CTP9_9BACI|nr:hypothetical protein [Terrilactibacillus tamarindi]MTT32443.1 hypothetical protein [Terrilactibacillus tamarindi]
MRCNDKQLNHMGINASLIEKMALFVENNAVIDPSQHKYEDIRTIKRKSHRF